MGSYLLNNTDIAFLMHCKWEGNAINSDKNQKEKFQGYVKMRILLWDHFSSKSKKQQLLVAILIRNLQTKQ
jgi:hypothetical protein